MICHDMTGASWRIPLYSGDDSARIWSFHRLDDALAMFEYPIEKPASQAQEFRALHG
jgi:hypothetical protein